MVEYRVRIYRSGKRLHQTKPIFAADEKAAKAKAQEIYDDLAAELKAQRNPPIDDPELGGFRLYHGDDIVWDMVR
jgi:hypothetical protein